MCRYAETVGTWANHAQEVLSTAGLRRGGARTAVIDLLDRQRCALSAYDVEELLGGKVARASVYRILEQLARHRLVTRIEVGQGVARYEAIRPNGHHHHHLVCDSCGDVEPFEDVDLERSIAKVAKKVPFAVAEHEVVLHGACEDCQATGARTNATSA